MFCPDGEYGFSTFLRIGAQRNLTMWSTGRQLRCAPLAPITTDVRVQERLAMRIARKSISLDHKVLGVVGGVSSIGLLFSLFSHDFVVDPVISEISVYISLGLIIFLCLIYWVSYTKGVFCSFRESSLFQIGRASC